MVTGWKACVTKETAMLGGHCPPFIRWTVPPTLLFAINFLKFHANNIIKCSGIRGITMSDDLLFPKFNFSMPRSDCDLPKFERPQFVKNAEEGIASEFYKRIVKWINDFDSALDDEHEVGVRLVSFGQSIVFHLIGIGYWDPFLISFSGTTEDSQPVELIQHVNQISILLMKLPRQNPDQPKRPIGFAPNSE
jgi:hypothetical protein